MLQRFLPTSLVLLNFGLLPQLLGQQPGHQQGLATFDAPLRRFEYKYSFKGPYLAQKDGTVPFWVYEGNAMASDEMVRITPSLRSKKGAIWTKYPANFVNWEVEIWFRVNGRGRLGADGLAFWFTEPKSPEGPVFGSADNWKGLGIFFDSFDNDNKGNNPYIMAMLNDGTKQYDHQTDGVNQQLSGCLRDFRNKPFPVRVKIEYYRNTLNVLFHSGNSNNDDEYELCLRVDNLFLPKTGYFGMSAATGGLADDHDVLKFLAYSLHEPTGQPQGQPGLSEEDKKKFSDEYETFKKKLDKQKEDYFKQHPDEARKLSEHEIDAEAEYDSLGERELKQIFSGQSQIFEVLKVLNRKLDEIVGRQERTLSIINTVQLGGGGGGAPAGAATGHVQMPIQRHEVEALLSNQRELLQSGHDIKNIVLQQPHGSGQQPQPVASLQQQHEQALNEIRDGVNVLKRELGNIGTKIMAGGGTGGPGSQPYAACPKSDCLSATFFTIGIILHLAVLIGYHVYRSSKDSQAKKFY